MKNGVRARAQIDARQHIDCLIRAASGEDPGGGYAVKGGQPLDERLRLRFGIAIEAGRRDIAIRPPRRFIRVQTRERRNPRSMCIGLQ